MTPRVFTPLVLFLVIGFLIGPFFIIVAASLSGGETLAFPPQGFSLQWVAKVFTVESFRESFAISMLLAIGGTAAALVLGVPASYALSRYKLPFGETVRTIVSLPIIVPGIIVGLALLRQLPPYEVVRVVDFINGCKKPRKVRAAAAASKGRKAKAAEAPAEAQTVVEEYGLFKNPPRALRTEVTRYLREREADPAWFDSTVLVARKAVKRLYALLHVAPGERAQKILFEDAPPAEFFANPRSERARDFLSKILTH